MDQAMTPVATESEERPHFLVIGEILRPHGVKGKLRVRLLTDLPGHFRGLKRAYLGETLRPVIVEEVHLHEGYALLKLAGYDDRTSVETLRGAVVQIPVQEALPLAQGEYYLYQIVGLAAWTVEGEYLGRVREVLVTGANDVYVVRGPRGEILLPAIEEVIREVDLEGGRLVVRLLEGLV